MKYTPNTTRILVAPLTLIGLLAGGAHAALVGSISFGAVPVSARVINGEEPTYWLNVENIALDFNDAMTGLAVVDTGWANIDTGSVLEFTFGTPIPNIMGPDFLLFDAQFDAGTCEFSTDFDAFVSQASVGTFVDTGVVQDYHFGANQDGPFGASVFEAAIDLSDLGVPDGADVTVIRIITTGAGLDPLGLVAVVPEPSSLSLFGLGGLMLAFRRSRR